MAKKGLLTIDGTHRNTTKGFVTIDSVHRKLKKGFVTIGGVHRPCWGGGGGVEYYGAITPLQYARYGLAAASVGSYAVFAGGVYVNGSDRVYYTYINAYDTSLTRTSPTALNYGGMDLAATSIGGYALFGGGLYANTTATTQTYSPYVNAYDASLVRTLAPNLGTGRRWLSAVTANGYALFGGGSSSAGHRNDVDTYNSSLTKEATKTLSSARSMIAAAAVGGYALFAGGAASGSDGSGTNRVDVFDSALTRTSGTALSVVKYNLAGSAVGNYALFAGGGTLYENGSVTDTVDSYNSSLTKGVASALSFARKELASTSINGFALFGGGWNGSGGSTRKINAEVDVYDASLTHTIATELSKGRYAFAATTVGNYALFGGGYDGSNRYADVDAYVVG